MKVEEIEQEALALTEKERVTLVTKLLDTLPPAGTDIPDEEVEQRENDLASGKVAAISQDEFERRVQRERGR
jgi:putative addiction module component (TIGR02574 family)